MSAEHDLFQACVEVMPYAEKGRLVPRFTQVEQIRSAGQGDVWISRDEMTGQLVAQKFLRRHGDARPDEAALARFRREVEAQSRLSHAGIMPIVDFDFEQDPPWYAMPLAEESLDDRLSIGLPLSEAELSGLVASIFTAVGSAHSAGLIHRDIKPANILRLRVDDESRWVIGDFGVCRDIRAESGGLTKSGIAIGTTRYMAPEQAENPHQVGPTADIYALGCVLYYCIVGAEPGTKQLDYERVPERYRDVLTKATALHRSQRYVSVSDFQLVLDQLFDAAGSRGSTFAGIAFGAYQEARQRVEEYASSSANLHSLNEISATSLAEDIFSLMGYRVHSDGKKGDFAFLVEDATRGLAPVVIRRRPFLTASADLIKTKSIMTAGDYRWAVFITTGRLSPEAQLFANGNKEILVLDGSGLRNSIDSLARRSITLQASGSHSSSEVG